jgi:hypothetical protein
VSGHGCVCGARVAANHTLLLMGAQLHSCTPCLSKEVLMMPDLIMLACMLLAEGSWLFVDKVTGIAAAAGAANPAVPHW